MHAYQPLSQIVPANSQGILCLQDNGDLVSNAVDVAGSVDAMNSAAVPQVHAAVATVFWSCSRPQPRTYTAYASPVLVHHCA